jgi:hypothetical protein
MQITASHGRTELELRRREGASITRANVNATYPKMLSGVRGPETHMVTMLVDILAEHTMRTLESLRFLFGKMEEGPSKLPNFIVDEGCKISILHLLAGSKLFTDVAQTTPLILNLCLDAYSEPSCINYRHQSLGTPLYFAAASGNKAMVERLCDRNADTSCNAGPDISTSVKVLLRNPETWTPLWASILRFDEELDKFSLSIEHPSQSSYVFLKNMEKTIELLSHTGDKLAREAIDRLGVKKKKLTNKEIKSAKKYTVDADDLPIDLSGLCAEGDDEVDKALLQVEDKSWHLSDSERALVQKGRDICSQLVVE